MTKTFSILLTLGALFAPLSYSCEPEMEASDYRILAQETNGQCASPGASYGCRFDSSVTYYPDH